jgi:tellurite resistance protein
VSDARVLRDREKALEDQFFQRHNEELKQKLRDKKHRDDLEAELSRIEVFANTETLDRMIELGLNAHTWAAVSLVPLVQVAWASGKVEDKERRAVLTAAEANGVVPGSESHQLLTGWLENTPDPRLFETWAGYVQQLCSKLPPAEQHALRDELVGRARHVAEAAGGFLGIGNKVSPAEKAVLEELAAAFGS